MIKYEDDCVGCDLPCRGSSCSLRNIPRCYCDNCKKQTEIYDYDGQELCEECLKEEFKKEIDLIVDEFFDELCDWLDVKEIE